MQNRLVPELLIPAIRRRQKLLLVFCSCTWLALLVGCSSGETALPQESTWKRYYQEGVKAYQEGRYSAAAVAWQQALDQARAFPVQDPRLHHTISNLGDILVLTGHTAQAESLYVELLTLQRQIGRSGGNYTAILAQLADVYRTQGKFSQAESLYVELLVHQQRIDPRHADLASTFNRLAALYRDQGRSLAADSLASRALAHKLHYQGYLYFMEGRRNQAESFFRRALTIQERKLGSDHPDLGRTCYHLGRLYELEGNTARAESFYRRALAIQEHQDPFEWTQTLEQLASILDQTGRSNEAATLRARALVPRNSDASHLEDSDG